MGSLQPRQQMLKRHGDVAPWAQVWKPMECDMSQTHALTAKLTADRSRTRTEKPAYAGTTSTTGPRPAASLGRQAQTPVEPGFLPLSAAQVAGPGSASGGIADGAADWLNSRYGDLPAEAVIDKSVNDLFKGSIAAVSLFRGRIGRAAVLDRQGHTGSAADLPRYRATLSAETLAYRDHLVDHLGLTPACG